MAALFSRLIAVTTPSVGPGLNQRQAVIILYLVSGCFGLSGVALADVSPRLVAMALLLVGLGVTLAIGHFGKDSFVSQHERRDVQG